MGKEFIEWLRAALERLDAGIDPLIQLCLDKGGAPGS